jgi:putative peptide zinc metalloprotease protein
VYHFFFKVLGIVLFVVEIIWFVLLPIVRELKVWQQRWPQIRGSRRSRRVGLALLAMLLLVMVPWPGRVTASAMLRPVDVWPVYAPAGVRVDALPFREGDAVPKDAALLQLHVPDLQMRRQALLGREELMRWQAATSGLDAQSQARIQVNERALVQARAELASLDAELLHYAPRAPYAGYLRNIEPDLQVGQWLPRREKLAVLVRSDSSWLVETWLDEGVVQRVSAGDTALFVAEGLKLSTLALKVVSVDRDASQVLPRGELAAHHGGHVLTREKGGQLVPERAVYRVALEPQDAAAMAGNVLTVRGQVVIHADWEAPAWRYVRQAAAVLLRETGF